MIVFPLMLIGGFLVALYYFAVYALPVAVGLWVGFWAMNSGAGIGSPIVGLLAGVAVFVLGQHAFHVTRSFPIRVLLMSIFGIPAGLVAYNAVLQLAEAAIPSSTWRHIFAVASAVIIGFTAAARVAAASPQARRRQNALPVYPPPPRSAGVDDVMLAPEQSPALPMAAPRRLLPPANG